MNHIDEKLRFYAHALVLGIVDVEEVNEWLFEVIEQNDLDDIPDDFFELVHYDQKQILDYFSEQRLTSNKSLQQGRTLLNYYLDKNLLNSSLCLLDEQHLKNLFNISLVFELEEVYTLLSLMDDDFYINYFYKDRKQADFLKFLDDIWLKVLNV